MAKQISQSPALLAPVARESEGEVFNNNEYEWNNPMYMDLVCVYVIAEHPAALERAHRIILRDMQSHLKHIHLASDLVYAEIYALKGFTLSESLCMYHYHLQCTLGAHMQVWVSTKGGMR